MILTTLLSESLIASSISPRVVPVRPGRDEIEGNEEGRESEEPECSLPPHGLEGGDVVLAQHALLVYHLGGNNHLGEEKKC